ncbi:MAG: hypothetical protein JSV79_08975 [Armatimonadota bacterium]|nr:MAG: hypothetical protein JSV79_08975 [Armatimonadota bacterium]
MTPPRKILLLLSLLSLAALLAGCPGMPGGPGAGQDNLPPGMKAPPGMESGGGRTLMGTTVTAPDNAILLVRHGRPNSKVESPWRSCRRLIVLDDCMLMEGINYDRRADGESDFNEVVPFSDIQSFAWKYEQRPTPPAEEESPAADDDK